MFSKIKTSTSTDDYSQQIKDIRELIVSAERVIIGAGAGLSTAAGLRYDGPESLVRINKDDVQSMYPSKRITAIKDDISAVLNAIF